MSNGQPNTQHTSDGSQDPPNPEIEAALDELARKQQEAGAYEATLYRLPPR